MPEKRTPNEPIFWANEANFRANEAIFQAIQPILKAREADTKPQVKIETRSPEFGT